MDPAIRGKLRRRDEKLLKRLERASSGNKKRKALYAYRRSGAVARLALEHENKKLPKGRRYTPEQLDQKAAGMNSWRPTQEPVRIVQKPKPNGGHRTIVKPGIKRKAASKILAEGLRPFLTFHPAPGDSWRQYTVPGNGGRPRACQTVKDIIEQGELKWITTADLRNAYASVRIEALRALPLKGLSRLPREILTKLLPDWLPIGQRQTRTIHGLVPGLAVSAVVLDAIVAHVLSSVPLGASRVVSYSDNLFVASRTRAEALALNSSLVAAFYEVAGRILGSLDLRVIERGRRACDGFTFLGYSYRKRRGCRVKPLERNLAKWRLGFLADRIMLRQERMIADQARARMRSWINGFRLWDLAEEFERIMSWQLDQAAALS
jgi:hypothetical protein